MNWGVLIAVLIYEVVSIVGIGAFMAYKNKKSGGAESGRLCICRWRRFRLLW